MPSVANALRCAMDAAVAELTPLRFDAKVACVYNPLVYAARAHRLYIERFGTTQKRALLLGMNPGPFGMVQTGVPFGEVEAVRGWLGIDTAVDKPTHEHPKRRIEGFACRRSEVSGRRLWSWCQQRFGTPERFFREHYIHNYCPLAFMEAGGRNLTPDKLDAASRGALFEVCDRYLRRVVAALAPQLVIGVGAFAEARARAVLADVAGLSFGRIPHPSPASPAANRGWDQLADRAFAELGLLPDAAGPARGAKPARRRSNATSGD